MMEKGYRRKMRNWYPRTPQEKSIDSRGVGNSLKLGEQKGGLVWRARQRESRPNGGLGQSPSGGPGGRAPGRGEQGTNL